MKIYLRDEASIQQELHHCELDFMIYWLWWRVRSNFISRLL